MSDLISRAEAIKTVKFYESFCDPYPRVIESLEKLPSAQQNNECEKCVFSPFKQFRQTAQPERKTGKWIREGWEAVYLRCSACGYRDYTEEHNNFCPNCGADMRGEQDG